MFVYSRILMTHSYTQCIDLYTRWCVTFSDLHYCIMQVEASDVALLYKTTPQWYNDGTIINIIFYIYPNNIVITINYIIQDI